MPDDAAGTLTPATPAELRALAAAAAKLADAVDDVNARLRAAGAEPVRRTGFRLEDLAGELRRAETGLIATASDLARARGADDGRLCPAEWGVCPDHGNTLTSSGGRSVCSVDGRSWDYDRAGSPCGEPIVATITDPAGGSTPTCHGHALAAPTGDGWVVHPTGPDGNPDHHRRQDR